MKKTLHALFIGLCTAAMGQTVTTGPSSSQGPYVLPSAAGYSVTSILTVTDVAGGYTLCGVPDGLGAFDNGDGTFTLLMNHEFGSITTGSVHAYGQAGAYVSKWIINKSTLAVVSGTDLTQTVNLWNAGTSTYSVYNSSNTSTLSAFARHCSADLAAVTAYYNPFTGKGTQARIFMNGEETGNEGRMLAHVATGTSAGNTYELPYLGKFSCENQVANPHPSDLTIVAGFDDSTPGQVYIYVGNKQTTGSEIDKAGLSGGTLYGVAVTGVIAESNTLNIPANSAFTLVSMGQVQAISGASLNTMSNNLGVTTFLRPEDGAWDPSHPNDLYFNTTNAFSNTTTPTPSRLWRLRFTDISNPQLGGTITAVLDGTEGQQMLDNLTIDNSGHVMLVEDVGNNAWLGRVLEYNINTDVLTPVAIHDSNRFITAAPNYLTQDEEASGIVDVQAILGPGKFLFVTQAHYAIPGAPVEGGQLQLLTSLNTATSNPEANVQGNSTNIASGNTAISAGDNTDFGSIPAGTNVSKTFVLQNTGTGSLVVSSYSLTGSSAFSMVSPPALPWVIAAGASQTLTISYNPAAVGTHSAIVNIFNNDLDENFYTYKIQGAAVTATNVGINSIVASGSLLNLYPNPTREEAVVSITLDKGAHVAIKVYDLQGKETGLLLNKDLGSGENQVTLNTAELKNGVYFVEVVNGEKSNKIKMVVKH